MHPEDAMMHPDLSSDPPRDPRLARALREASPDAPLERVDWPRLHAAIDARAAAVLARRGQPWWAYAAGWSRAAVPVAAAACVALVALLAATPRAGGAAEEPVRVAASSAAPMMEEALSNGISDPDRALLAGDGDDWLLQAALPAPEER
jgi:hypothetical protein